MRLVSTLCFVSAVLGAGALAGCELEPLVSDEPGASIHVLPPGTAVDHVSSNPDMTRQIRINDGLSDMALEMSMGVVPLKKAWAGGAQVMYWDLGDAPKTVAQLYVLVRRDGEGEDAPMVPIDHLYITDSIPGDRGYSPFWLVQYVPVTEKYRGEVLPSLEAIVDAIDLGLVEEPIAAMEYADGPIVAYGTKLDRGADQTQQSTMYVYSHGYMVDMMAIGGPATFLRPMTKAGKIPQGDSHKIWLPGAVAGKDIVFQNGASPWTPVARIIDCHVNMPADPMDPSGPIHDEAQLFTRDMMGALASSTDRVESWTISMSLKNWPIYVPEAAP